MQIGDEVEVEALFYDRWVPGRVVDTTDRMFRVIYTLPDEQTFTHWFYSYQLRIPD